MDLEDLPLDLRWMEEEGEAGRAAWEEDDDDEVEDDEPPDNFELDFELFPTDEVLGPNGGVEAER